MKAGDRNVFWPRSVTHTLEIDAFVQQILDETDFGGPTPVTLTTLTESPHEYLPFLYRILRQLEDYNENQLDLSDDVQTGVTRRWVWQFLGTLPVPNTLGSYRKGRLVTSILNSINRGDDFTIQIANREDILETIEETRTKIANSLNYMDSIQNGQDSTVNREDCFLPDASTFIIQKRLFNILPMCKYRRRFVSVDLRTLQTIMRVSNQRLHQEERFEIDATIEDGLERHQRATLEFEKVLNLHKVISNTARENKLFTNCIRTDGYAVDFIFAKRTNMDVLPNLEFEDFTPCELENTFRLWGLDPGQKSVFTAVDGHTNDQHEIRKFSTAEFYTFAGYKRTSRRIEELKNSPEHPQIRQAESNLTTSKTARPDIFHTFLQSFYENARVLLNFYSLDIFRELRFHNYVDKQKAEAELVNIFVDGGKKYRNVQAPARTPRG